MGIELTPPAVQEIRQLLSEQPEGGKGLSLQVGVNGLGPQRDFTLDLAAGQAPPDEQPVWQALRQVIDPEVGINIVDLGLVYGIATDGRRVRITMTMTTPACPLGEQIKREVDARLSEQCPGVERVDVDIVWEPPWGPERMSQQAKQMLGWSR